MQILNLRLTFGNNETYLNNRTLKINIDDKYPLEFSIVNAQYDVNSFEQNSNVEIKLTSITPTRNSINFGNDYIVDLFVKFPLNTFDTSDESVNLTFNEYNKQTKNYDIKFISKSQINKKFELNNDVYIITFCVIICGFVLIHFDLSLKYNLCVNKCLKKDIIYEDGWKLMRYSYRGPIKIVGAYRFKEAKRGDDKDYLYYRSDRYSPKEIFKIVNGLEITSFQIKTYKERIKNEIWENYIQYDRLDEALNGGMPDKIEFKVIWLRTKIYELIKLIENGPKKSNQTWHGPYGWIYESTEADIARFNSLEIYLIECRSELQKLKVLKLNNKEDDWYWYD